MEAIKSFFAEQMQPDLAVPSGERNTQLSEAGGKASARELLVRSVFATDPRGGIELLYRYYYQSLCSHAVRLLYSRVVAEDLVSEVFCQLYANDCYLDIKTSYRAYLYKTVRNRALNYKRDELRCKPGLSHCVEMPDADEQRPDTQTEYEELCEQLEAGIRVLPEKRRRIFLMHRFENKKYTEIAEELQLSPRTVEVQIRKACHFLRQLLQKYLLLFVYLFWMI